MVIWQNKTIAFALSITLICTTSCSERTSQDLPSAEVTGLQVNVSDGIEDARIIYADSSSLYFRHSHSPLLLSRYDVGDDSILCSGKYIPRGNAHGEMHSLMLYSLNRDGSSLMFYDPNIRKAIEFDCNSDSTKDWHNGIINADGANIFRFATGNTYGTLATFVSQKEDKHPSIVGFLSDKDSTFYPLENVGREDMRDLSLYEQMYYAPNSQVFVQPISGDKCLFISCAGQYAEIFEIDGNQAVNKKILINEIPEFSINERGHISSASDDLKYGFEACVTQSYIYLAPRRITYSERSKGLNENPKYKGTAKGPNFNDEIWKYDWNGNLIGKYVLNPGFSSFWVSPYDVVWATSENEDSNTIIMRYDL